MRSWCRLVHFLIWFLIRWSFRCYLTLSFKWCLKICILVRYLAWDFVIHFDSWRDCITINDTQYPVLNLITALWVDMIRLRKFSFRFLLLSSFFWWDAVVEFAVQGFLGSFRLEMLFGIASKPVQRTDLVDASESRWGGKKNGLPNPMLLLTDARPLGQRRRWVSSQRKKSLLLLALSDHPHSEYASGNIMNSLVREERGGLKIGAEQSLGSRYL